MTRTILACVLLSVAVMALTNAKRPCNWRCNAPECMCIRRTPVEISECICAGERALGEECLDDLQCSDGNKCVEATCTEVPKGPPQAHRWFYQDIFDKQEK